MEFFNCKISFEGDIGFGGFCFPKDLQALSSYLHKNQGVTFHSNKQVEDQSGSCGTIVTSFATNSGSSVEISSGMGTCF